MGILTLMIAQEQLTDNTNELKAIVYQLIGVVEEQKLLIANQNQRIKAQTLKVEAQSQEIKALCQKNEEQAQKIDELSYAVSILKRHRFGKRSEKFEGENATPDDTTADNTNDNTDTSTSDNGSGNTDTTTSPDAQGVFSELCQSARKGSSVKKKGLTNEDSKRKTLV
ncbi:MAG: hypothetical protein H0X26_10270 [Alphaproteobacteria bacterium]|nr:hypothetical protein [Alphaproteobacteria bacterium]